MQKKKKNRIFSIGDIIQVLGKNACLRVYFTASYQRQRNMTGMTQSKQLWGHGWDGRFGSKGQIRSFFRADFSAFGAGAPNALKSDLKKLRICPIWGQSDPLWSQTYHPWPEFSYRRDDHVTRGQSGTTER